MPVVFTCVFFMFSVSESKCLIHVGSNASMLLVQSVVLCRGSPVGRVNSPILPFVVCVCLCLFSVCNLARGEAEFVAQVTFDVLVDPLPG